RSERGTLHREGTLLREGAGSALTTTPTLSASGPQSSYRGVNLPGVVPSRRQYRRITAMRNTVLPALLISACAAAVPAHAADEEALSALDYIEIQQLVARYARAIDTCSNNGYDYADLFTPDGAFIAMFNGEPAAEVRGRERL